MLPLEMDEASQESRGNGLDMSPTLEGMGDRLKDSMGELRSFVELESIFS